MEGKEASTESTWLLNITTTVVNQSHDNFSRGFPGKHSPYTATQVSSCLIVQSLAQKNYLKIKIKNTTDTFLFRQKFIVIDFIVFLDKKKSVSREYMDCVGEINEESIFFTVQFSYLFIFTGTSVRGWEI